MILTRSVRSQKVKKQ